MQLLHISDFHISVSHNATSPLSQTVTGKKYLEELCETIPKEYIGKVDYIVASGDFVHKHDVSGFQVASWVISTLSSYLGVPNARIIVCAGNHDYIWDLQKTGATEEARAGFSAFAKQYAAPTKILGLYASLFVDDARKVSIISLDSTWNSLGREPGRLTDQELEEVHRLISEVSGNHDLVIVTHFPPIFLPELACEIDVDEDFISHHYWKSGADIAGRFTRGRRVTWLFGDLHFEDEFRYRDDTFFLSGSLGMSPDIDDTFKVVLRQPQVSRSARFVTINTHQVTSQLLTYDIRSWNPANWNGSWKLISGNKQSLSSSSGIDTLSKRASNLQLLSVDLQDSLLDIVRFQKLYRFGRFKHDDGVDVLANIQMAPLFVDGTILRRLVLAMAKWLIEKVGGDDACRDSMIIVAVDCWGTLIATHLAARLGCHHFSFVRTSGSAMSEMSKSEADVRMSRISHIRHVALICDIVTVGRGFAEAHKFFSSSVGADANRTDWWCLSVFCDETHELTHRAEPLAFVSAHATAVSSLKIPIIRDGLPDENIVPYSVCRL